MSDGEDVGLLDAVADSGVAEDVAADEEVVAGAEDTSAASDGRDGAGTDDNASADAKGEGDKRTLPVQIRNAIRKFNEANPDFAKENPRFEKEVIGALFARNAINDLGGIQAIRSLKETIDVHGGIEGIQESLTELEAHRTLDGGLEKGDPQVIEGYVRDYPEGFKRIVPTALDALAKNFPEDYQRLGSTMLHNTFRDNRTYDDVTSLGKAIEASKDPAAIAAYNRLVDMLLGVQKSATSKPADPYADRAKQLDEREQSLAKQHQTSFLNGVRSEVDNAIVKDVNKMIATALKGRALDTDTRNRLMNEIRGALANKVHNEPNYSRQWPGVRDAGNHERAVKFNYAAYSKALPNVVSGVMKTPLWRSYFNGTAKAAPAARTTERPANATVTGRPAISDVDFSRTDKATFLGARQHGQAWLKSGKQAKW